MSRVRSAADWLSVRDPGWGRAQMGWRTLVGLVAGLATGYFAAPALGLPALLGLVFGGLLGLLPGLIVPTPRPVSWPVTWRGTFRPSRWRCCSASGWPRTRRPGWR